MSRGGVLLDQTPSFNVDAIYQRLADYGEEGRKSYWFRNCTVDIILPLSLLPFLFLLMLYAVRSIQLKGFARILLLSLPFAYVIFDLAENAVVLVLLKNYPSRMNLMAQDPTVPDLGQKNRFSFSPLCTDCHLRSSIRARKVPIAEAQALPKLARSLPITH